MTINTLANLHKQLKAKTISSDELVQESIKNAKNSALNAFITITEEQASKHQTDNDSSSPLAGIPIAQKDLFCTEGVLTS